MNGEIILPHPAPPPKPKTLEDQIIEDLGEERGQQAVHICEALAKAKLEQLVSNLAAMAVELFGIPREEAERRARQGLLDGSILYDPPWAFSVPNPGASAGEVDRWVSEVADAIQDSDEKVSRAEAEEAARRMLAREQESSPSFDLVAYGADRWLSEVADEVEVSWKVPRAEAEQIARCSLAEILAEIEAVKDARSARSDRQED